MTGYDAAEKYIEKVAFGAIGSTIWNNIKNVPMIGSRLMGTFSGQRMSGKTMMEAAKEALGQNVFKGLTTEQMKHLGRLGTAGKYVGVGAIGRGTGNYMHDGIAQQQPQQQPDVQVVYANPNRM
jgi:hypothetical protein